MSFRARWAISAAALAAVSACASPPSEIQPHYVSTLEYRDYDCDQLAEEARRISHRAQQLHASLQKKADNDAAQMGVGLVLFWPTLFFLEGGDGVEAQEYARLKGQRDAIESVSIQRKCGIEFEPIEPPKPAPAEEPGTKNWASESS